MKTLFTQPQPKAIGLTPKTCCNQTIKSITVKGANKIKLFLLLAIQVLAMQASAQVTVSVTGNTNTTPNLATSYTSLASAITALNSRTAFSGAVTLTCAAGSETAPAGGYAIQLTAATSATNTITISTSGAVTLTAPAQTTASLNDAIFKIIGGDYITIQGFTMQENSANTTTAAASNNMTEWGVALLRSSTTNGAQNNTIRNNTISLNRSYSNTFGIYSNTTHSATDVINLQDPSAASGTNSNNRVYSNSISNVNYGIVFISPGSFATITNMDSGNDIGGASSSTGNTISNCGGVVSATSFNGRMSVPYCILMSGQSNFNLSYNSITSASFSSTFAFGIYITGTPSSVSNTFAQNITNNTITMTMTGTAGQYNSFQGICHEALAGTLPNVTVNITNNTLLNCQSAANFYGITASSFAAGTLNINGNIIRGTTLTGTTGDFVGIASSSTGAVTHNINNNQFGTAASPLVTFSLASSGIVRCVNFEAISNSASPVNIQNNNVQGIVHNVAGTGAHKYFDIPSTSVTPRNLNVSGNTFSNLSVNTSGSITFFWNEYTMPLNGTQVYNNNSIVGTFTKSVGSGNVNIFYHVPITTRTLANAAGTFTYTNNNFRNIVCSGTSTITAIINTDRGSKIINNNTFRNWQAPAGITCINVSGFNGALITSNSISSNTLDSLASNAFTSIILGQTTLTPATAVLSVENNTISRIFTSGSFTGFSSSALFNTLNINSNSISGVQLSGATSAFTGISSTGVVSAALNINNNQFGTVSTNLVTFSAATSGNLNCVTISGNAPASAYTIQNNDVRGIVHSTAGTGTHTYYSCVAPLMLNVIGNTFTNLSVNTSGAITFFSTTGNMPNFGGQIFTNNSIVGGFTKSAANGAITVFSQTATASLNAGIDHSYNNFRKIVCSGTSAITGITNTDVGTKQIFNNTFRNWQAGSGGITGITLAQPGSSSLNNINENNIDSLATSGNITGIFLGNTGSNTGPINVTNNIIGRLFTSLSGTVTGISNTYAQTSIININNNSIGPISTVGTSASITGISVSTIANHNIFANKIFDLNNTVSTTVVVTGILASNGTTNNIYNNRIGNLSASASTNANAVIGLNISGGTTANVYYNTIYLNNLTGGATFGASGIFAAITPTLTLNNNLVRVTGTAAGLNGRIAAYRRLSTGLSTYSTSSNNNMFYAGTPSSTNLIFVEGLTSGTFANPQQTLAAYKAYMSTRDQASTIAASASVPSFLSTTGSSADFLKLNQTNVSDVENVGLTISGYSVDFEADTRNNPPDIGADEICVSPGVPTGLTSQTRCGGNGTVTFTVADPGVGNTIEWSNNGVTTNGSTGLNYSPSIIVESPINVYARAVNTASGCRSAWTSVVYGTAYYSPTATAGAALSAICQGATSSAMGGSVGGGATGGTWSGGAGTWTNANNPIAATYTAGASESGSITLTLTTSGGSCGTTTAAKTITVNLSPTANAGSALSICQGASSSAMGGSVGGGATGGTWSGGVGTWTSATNPSTATYLASASESGSITLTLTTSGGSCGITTTTKTITVNANPTASAGGVLSAICQSGTSAAMGGSVGGGATGGTWSGGAGSWTNATNPSSATYTAGASESGSITLTLTTSGGSCGTTTTTKTITVNPNPTATAGAALAARCQGLISAAMGGSVGGGATGGTWSGGAGSWTNATNPSTATYTAGASESGSITLTLTTSGGSCGITTATKTITVNPNPTASAGGALSAICQNGTSAAMGGSVGGGATGGTWSGGAGSWTNATNPSTATYTAGASESGSITLSLTTSGGSCGTTTATKTITINQNPTINAGGALSAICQSGTSAAMGGSVGGGATGGTWSGGAGSWTNATNPSTATYTAGASESGSITLTLTTSGGSCGTTTATKTITVNPNPTASAGGALSAICQSGTSAAMGGSFGGGATSGTWSGGAGSWTNATNPSTATYTAGASESGSITLTLTTSGGSCGTTTANKTITINQNPTVNAGGALSAICQGETSLALGGSVGGGATGGTWSDGGAGGTFNPNSTTINATYTAALNAPILVTLTLTSNGGLCGTANASKNETVNPIAVIGNFTSTICNGSLFTVNPTGTIPTGTTYSWPTPIYSSPNVSGGSAQSGQDNVSQTLTNSGTTIQTATYTVTPTSGLCDGANFTVTVTVYPNLVTPTNTYFDFVNVNTVNLIWNATPNATNYRVEYSTDPLVASPTVQNNGTNTTLLTTGLVYGTIYYYKVRSENAVCGASNWSDITPFTVSAIVWEGSVSSDWNNTNNWAPRIIPTANDSAILFDVANDPKILQAGLNGICRYLIFRPASNLQIETGKELVVKDHVTSFGSGGIVTGPGRINMNGSTAQIITGNNSFSNLFLNNSNGISLTSGITSITGVLTTNVGTLTTNGNLKLVSNASTTGMISGTGAGLISGNVEVNRFMPGNTGYRYISSPITQATGLSTLDFDVALTGTNGLVWDPLVSIPSPFPNCWYYDETIDNYYSQYGWTAATSGALLQTGRGYALITPANHTATLVGPVNTGAVTATNNITRTGTFSGAGVNLVGNPYPSPISWNAFRTLNGTSEIAAVVKRFASTGQYFGQYVDWNGVVGTPGSVGDNIALGQAFFITKTNTGSLPVNFTNAIRVDNASTTFYEAQPEVNNLLRVQLVGGAGADEFVLYFDPTATNNYDVNYDAIKFLSETAGIPNIYTNIDSLKVSINVLKKLSQDMVIPMGIVAKTAGNYQINVLEHASFAPTSMLYLEDRTLGIWSNLRTTNQYSVSLPVGEHNGRFFLHFRPAVDVNVANETCQQADGSVTVANASMEQQWTASLLNTQGELVAQSSGTSITFNNLSDGNYTLRLVDANGYSVEQSIAIEAAINVAAVIAPLTSSHYYTSEVIEASVQTVVSGATYEWYLNGVLKGTGSNISMNVTEAGMYTLTLKMYGSSCVSETNTTFAVTQESTVGIATAESASSFNIYPNPTNEVLNIVKSEKWEASIELIDALGKTVLKRSFVGTTLQINTQQIKSGVYTIVIHQSNINLMEKVVVVH